jgi:transcriptional regulator with XRE-family HTH domain
VNRTPAETAAHRYIATSNLGAVLETQGRKMRWLADRIGVSESKISHVLAGRHTVDRDQGERIAGILGVPFSVLFELRERSDTDPSPEEGLLTGGQS